MIDVVTLHSIPYDYTVTLPRRGIHEILTNSLLDKTLTLDPEASSIDIPNVVVCPEVMDLISIILDTRSISCTIISDSSYRQMLQQASNYLAIDIIDIILDDRYEYLSERYNHIDLVDIRSLQDKDTYGSLLNFAIDQHFPLLLNYVLDRVPPELYTDIDNRAFLSAVGSGQISSVDPFIRRGINPNISMCVGTILSIPIRRKHSDLSNYLLSLPEVKPTLNDLLLASRVGNLPIVERLLQDPNIDPSSNHNEALINALDNSELDVAQRLYEDPRVSSTYDPLSHPNLGYFIQWDVVENNFKLIT